MTENANQIGDWRLIREIGRGAMGVVHLAERADGWEQVAIKLMHPEMAANPEMVSRFFAEARAISRVLHPNVVKLEDYGQAEGGSCYLVMELLDGESLTSLVRRHGVLPIERAVNLGAQIAEGLAAAHDHGIIHRDLKPDNVIVVQRRGLDMVKVLDFGLAKITGESLSKISHAGGILGTPHYMAPEAARGSKSVDHRVDIYALGCILYEMVTGSVLFPAAAFGEALVRHVYDAPTPPSAVNANVTPALEQVILRALSKDPKQRFVSMTEMAWALRRPDGAAAKTSLPSDIRPSLPDPLASQPRMTALPEAEPLPPIHVELQSVAIELDFLAPPSHHEMPQIESPAQAANLDSLPPIPTVFDPMPTIEMPAPAAAARAPDSLPAIAGEVTVITPPGGMAPTSDFGYDAPTEISAFGFDSDVADITAKSAKPPSPFEHARFDVDPGEATALRAATRPTPVTQWDEPEATDYVPPLVAVQLFEKEQKAARGRRVRRVVASAMTTTAVIAIGLFVWLRPSPHEVGPGAVATAPEVTVTLQSDPPGADVFTGELALGKTPMTLRRPRAEQMSLRLVKPGYHKTDAFVSLAGDQRITIKLERETSAPPTVAQASPSAERDAERGTDTSTSARGRKVKRPPARAPETKVTGDELIQLQF